MRPIVAGCLAFAACAAVVHAQQVKPVRDQKPPAAETQRQQATAAAGVIAGTVVSADSGNAVRRAKVSLVGGSPRVSRSIDSDEQGAFRFTDLPAGDFTLTATKGGYVESTFGQAQPGSGRPGTPIHLLDKQQLDRVSLRLSRGAVITGAVFDETGEPSFGESVELLRWVMTSGDRVLEYVATANTDDRGMYRFPALQNGDYVVCTIGTVGSGDYDISDGTFYKIVKPYTTSFTVSGNFTLRGTSISLDRNTSSAPAAPTTGFASVYYPGTTDYSNAQSLTVHAGEERSGVDFHLQLAPIGRIAGMVTGPDGPVPGVEVRLINKSQPAGLHVRSMRAEKDGRFEFSAVTPGEYQLFVHATPKTVKLAMAEADFNPKTAAAADEKKRAALAAALSASADLWAMADVTATGSGVAEAALTLQPGITISGHVTTEGTGAPPNLARLMLGVQSVGQHPSGQDVNPAPVLVDANGDFVILGVMPGKYRIAISSGAPSGYIIQSAIFGGRDVLDVPFVLTGNEQPANGLVTLTNRLTELTGVVQTAAGQPATDITVLAFSGDEKFWTPQSRRIQAVRPSTDGKYTFRNLPPGDYRLIAVSDIEPGRWFDPALLRALAGFAIVTLGDGAHVTQDLRLR